MSSSKKFSIGDMTMQKITPLVRAVCGQWVDCNHDSHQNQVTFDTRKDPGRSWGDMIGDINQTFDFPEANTCDIQSTFKKLISEIGCNDIDQLTQIIATAETYHPLTATEAMGILAQVDDGHDFKKANITYLETSDNSLPEEVMATGVFFSPVFWMNVDTRNAKNVGEKIYPLLNAGDQKSLTEVAAILRAQFDHVIDEIEDQDQRDTIRNLIFG